MSSKIEEANKPFAKGLEVIIARKGLKQIYVAKIAGYTQQQLNRMLNGRKMISAKDIVQISKALGESPDAIFQAGRESTDV